jgi:hypothetical protein
MKRSDPPSLKLSRLYQRLEAWRQHRHGRRPIPEPFWTDAVALARTEGISRVSRVLRMHYNRLKDRLAQSPTPAPVSLPTFVEVAVAPSPNRRPECLLELLHPTGTKMTIHFPTGSSAELLPWAEAFWHQRR